MGGGNGDLGRTLAAAAEGDTAAARTLLGLVYDELRELARARMARLPAGQTLQPTALVHEAYLRVAGDADAAFENRRHFFFAAARAMRDILVEQARRRASLKRGGGRSREALGDPAFELGAEPEDVVAIGEALARLEGEDPEGARVVALRFFVGLTHEQIADVMGVSLSTVERRWRFARAWLGRELGGAGDTLGD